MIKIGLNSRLYFAKKVVKRKQPKDMKKKTIIKPGTTWEITHGGYGGCILENIESLKTIELDQVDTLSLFFDDENEIYLVNSIDKKTEK
jgi:hypothetical protein